MKRKQLKNLKHRLFKTVTVVSVAGVLGLGEVNLQAEFHPHYSSSTIQKVEAASKNSKKSSSKGSNSSDSNSGSGNKSSDSNSSSKSSDSNSNSDPVYQAVIAVAKPGAKNDSNNEGTQHVPLTGRSDDMNRASKLHHRTAYLAHNSHGRMVASNGKPAAELYKSAAELKRAHPNLVKENKYSPNGNTLSEAYHQEYEDLERGDHNGAANDVGRYNDPSFQGFNHLKEHGINAINDVKNTTHNVKNFLTKPI